MIRNCDTCYHRKTDRCPNSSECYETENKPYYEPTIRTARIKINNENKFDINDFISKQQLISFLEDNIRKRLDTIKFDKEQDTIEELENIISRQVAELNAYQEVLYFVNKGSKE